MFENQDLSEFVGGRLQQLIVEVDSITLDFNRKTRVVIKCPFECLQGKSLKAGNGADRDSVELFFDFIEKKVEAVFFDAGKNLIFDFQDGWVIKIIPHENNIESYLLAINKSFYPMFENL